MEEIKISGKWVIEEKEYKGDIYILKNKKNDKVVATICR